MDFIIYRYGLVMTLWSSVYNKEKECGIKAKRSLDVSDRFY